MCEEINCNLRGATARRYNSTNIDVVGIVSHDTRRNTSRKKTKKMLLWDRRCPTPENLVPQGTTSPRSARTQGTTRVAGSRRGCHVRLSYRSRRGCPLRSALPGPYQSSRTMDGPFRSAYSGIGIKRVRWKRSFDIEHQTCAVIDLWWKGPKPCNIHLSLKK